MYNLKAKLKKQGGFTLVEMLIVVAIIAILIAVSIPLINNALDRAKHATDAANERAAKAEILICYLADAPFDGTNKVVVDTTYNYDAVNGKLLAENNVPDTKYGQHLNHDYLTVEVDENGEVTLAWKAGGGLCSSSADVDHT